MCSSGTDRVAWKGCILLLLLGMIRPAAGGTDRIDGEWPAVLPRMGSLPPPVHPLLRGKVAPVHLPEDSPPQSGRKAEKKGFRRQVYWSAALALSSGVLAWWSKERADRAYARYLRSAGLRRQKEQFDRAERFDRIAGAAFAGMEVGVGLTTYFLFF